MTNPAGGMNLGTAYGSVVIRNNISDAMAQARRDFDVGLHQIGRSMQRTGDMVAGFGQNLTAFTAPIIAMGGFGVKIAGDFEATLTEIQARTGSTASEMEAIRQKTLQLGADTVFSSSNAADSFLQLLTAGLSVDEAMGTIDATMTAAAASGESLGRTADLVTNVMSAFALEADDVSGVIDSISRAAASSPASMSEIGESLQAVGGLATSFGMDVDETAAVMAIFAQNGIRGAEAGTQLRSMLLNMNRDTEQTQSAWATLGTSMYDAEGNMRDLDKVFGEIGVAMDDMTDAQKTKLISDLAGSYGLIGFNAMLASDGIVEMQSGMATQATASEVAEARMSTFNGVITSLIGSVETLAITALTPFMNNVLRPLAEQLITVVNGFTDWVSENEGLVQIILTLGGTLLAIGPILWLAGTLFSALGAAIALAFAPITLLSVAFLALMAAVHFGYEGGIPQMLMDASSAAQMLVIMFGMFLQHAVEEITRVINDMISAVTDVITGIRDWISANSELMLALFAFSILMMTSSGSAIAFEVAMKAVRLAMIAVNTVTWLLSGGWALLTGAVGLLTGGVGLATTGIAGMAITMMGAIAPILAVGAAIAAVIAKIHEFNEQVQAAASASHAAIGGDIASGAISDQQLADASFNAVSAEFGGGFVGDLAARLMYNNVAQGAKTGSFHLVDTRRATGGMVHNNMPYLVGEEGPELFVPDGSGHIVPNGAMGSGVNISGVTVYANDYAGGQQAAQGFVDELTHLMRSQS